MESASLLNKQEEARSPSSFTHGVLLGTSVAVAGSFCYGCAMSYTSPAQSKIMEELGLSVADVSLSNSKSRQRHHLQSEPGPVEQKKEHKLPDLTLQRYCECLVPKRVHHQAFDTLPETTQKGLRLATLRLREP
ncbi:hypothetical protein Bca4012_061798 [Brassica carinata]